MFERFTERARRVLVLAEEEARLLNHSFISTEHILLGLIREGDGVGAKALESLGISLEAVRERAAETPDAAATSILGPLPFTAGAMKVLELSHREASELGHREPFHLGRPYIATEHMLLGLVRDGAGGTARVLGTDLNGIRHVVIQLLPPQG